MIRALSRTLLALGVALLGAHAALAADPRFELTIRDHRFTPDTLRVPADTKIQLVIHNADATSEEFESQELNREKVIPGKATATINIGPLKPGTYPFVGEFHEKTAQGRIIAE